MTQPAPIQAREEDNTMENANAYIGINEGLEIPSEERAPQAFEQILSSVLPRFYLG